ncbi:MAG TPA: hypothetical protein VIJ97_06885 [Candidatus Anoxymicrobiaceae bacterium]
MKGRNAIRSAAVAAMAIFMAVAMLTSLSWGLAAGGIQRVSTRADGSQANNESQFAALSMGETYAVFCTAATNVVPGTGNGKRQIYRKNLTSGSIECVSTAPGCCPANQDCQYPCVSLDGRYVAFSSTASNLIAGLSGQRVYRKDVQNDTIMSCGTGDNPSMSWDGKYIAFQSSMSPWALDLNNAQDVFRIDCDTGNILAVSCPVVNFVSPNFCYTGNAQSGSPSISLDGRYVAFTSDADNMVPNDHNNTGGAAILFQGGTDVFRKDMQTGDVIRCSTSSTGVEGNRDSWTPTISPDGRYVLYNSMSYNLVPGDTDINMINSGRLGQEIFRKDTQTGQTIRCCTSATGVAANNEIQGASVNASGSIIAFATAANNLVPGDTNGKMDVFVKDLSSGKITRVSMSATGTQGNGDSGYYGWWPPSINMWGNRVVFASDATNLVSGDTNAKTDIFYKSL